MLIIGYGPESVLSMSSYFNIRVFVTSHLIPDLPSSVFQAISAYSSLLTTPSKATTIQAHHNRLDFTCILTTLGDVYRLDH
jgi:hypothetical protein